MVFSELSFPSSGATTTSGITAGTLDADLDVVSPPAAAPAGYGGGSVSGLGLEDDKEGSVAGEDREATLLYLKDHTAMCCGVIGGSRGTRFCLQPAGKCTIKAHEQKATILDEALYIRTGKHNASIFPRLKATSLPKSWAVEDLLKETKPFSVWAVFLEQSKEREGVKVETVNDEVEIEFDYALEQITAAKEAFKTPSFKRPGRNNGGSLLFDMVDSSPQGEHPLRKLSALKDDESIAAQDAKLLVMIGQWNDLLSNIDVLDDRMKNLRLNNHNYKESLQSVVDDLTDRVQKSLGGLQLLNTQLGMEASYDRDAFNVRDWIGFLQSDVNKLETRISNEEIKTADYELRIEGMEGMIETQQEGMEELEEAMNTQFGAVERTFLNLQQAARPQKSNPVRPRSNKLSRAGTGLKTDECKDLKREMSFLKAELDELRKMVEHPTFPTIQEEGGSDDESGSDDFSGISKRVKELETRLGDQGFSGGDEVFASFSDVKNWVVSEGIESSGIFWDLLSVLIAMEPAYMSGKEFADAEYSSARIKSTALETDLSASMKQHRPRILFANSKAGALPKIEKGFGACTSYKEWIGGAESFKSEVGELVRGFRGGVWNVIISERGDWSDRGCALALELLSGVRDQWSELMAFIDSFYQLLTDVANFVPQKAWALVGRCVATVFTAMRIHREKVFKMRDDGSAKNRANIIWAVLQCHRVMNEFIKVDFKGHPLIVQAINTFMITERVDPEVLASAVSKIKILETDNTALHRTVSKLEETVATLNRSHKDLANELKQLKKKGSSTFVVEAPHREENGHRDTLRGLTTGQAVTQPVTPGHLIIGGTYSWLLLVCEGLVTAHTAFFQDLSMLEIARSLLPSSCLLFTDWARFDLAVRNNPRPMCVMVDGGWQSRFSVLGTYPHVVGFMLTRGLRRAVAGWTSVSRTVAHLVLGGVTDGSFVGTFLRRQGSSDGMDPPSLCLRDVSTVLEDAPTGRPCLPPPAEVVPLGVRYLDTDQTVIHGRGLVPWPCPAGLHVCTPSLFAPRGCWVERRLSVKERLGILDIPLGIQDVLGTPSSGVLTRQVPLLVLRWFLSQWRALHRDSGLGTGGVIFDFDPSSSLVSIDTPTSSPVSIDTPTPPSSPPPSSEPAAPLPHHNQEGTHKILEEMSQAKREKVATKADDAEVPVELWRASLFQYYPGKQLTKFQMHALGDLSTKLELLGLRRWRRNVWKEWRTETKGRKQRVDKMYASGKGRGGWRESYRKWHALRRQYYGEELVLGLEVLEKSGEATWWEWKGGSILYYWRWPKCYRARAKHGLRVFFTEKRPLTKEKQKTERDEGIRQAIQKKVAKVLKRRYLGSGAIRSLISFFAVPKGDSDIRVVYNGTSSGLNKTIWVPRFPLPTLARHLRQVNTETPMADADLGEMFLNFPLHELLREVCGVDLSQHVPVEGGGRHWVRWVRAAMGLKSLPYQCTQGCQIALELALGDRRDETNVFRWDYVDLNLPGSETYDPSKPWVSLRRKDGSLAAFVVLFVDDLRVMGGSERECWLACRRVSATFNYLGVQDAARKRRSSCKTPGAWAGGVVHVNDDGVFVLVSEEKWNKAKGLIIELKALVETDPVSLPRKRLEQIRGFLGYVSQTYPILGTYLKGLHLTIDQWRSGRDEDGWKLREWIGGHEDGEAPPAVKAVPRLKDDVRAMEELTKESLPPMRRVRMQSQGEVIYGFGDASARGFGATLERKDGVVFEYGQWITSVADETSSNWKELCNLIESVERWHAQGWLTNRELWLFTDNTTAENAFWKGTSRSKKLFDLVLRIKKLEMKGDFVFHVVHVSGTRMIAQGTDGISRGDKGEGVLAGRKMEEFISLHQTVLDRSPGMQGWIKKIMGNLEHTTLSPAGWFEDVKREGNFVWTPAPACGEVVVEQLGNARHKRPNSLHVVVIPRLLTGRWRRMMTRATDAVFTLWPDPAWQLTEMFEPVLVFVGLPYLSHRPLLDSSAKRMEKLRRDLSSTRLPEKDWRARRDILREFLAEARRICPV